MNNIDPQRIYDLGLMGVIGIDNNSIIRRVPGGWVYSDMQGCCFIPFDNEFQPLDEKEPSFNEAQRKED